MVGEGQLAHHRPQRAGGVVALTLEVGETLGEGVQTVAHDPALPLEYRCLVLTQRAARHGDAHPDADEKCDDEQCDVHGSNVPMGCDIEEVVPAQRSSDRPPDTLSVPSTWRPCHGC